MESGLPESIQLDKVIGTHRTVAKCKGRINAALVRREISSLNGQHIIREKQNDTRSTSRFLLGCVLFLAYIIDFGVELTYLFQVCVGCID